MKKFSFLLLFLFYNMQAQNLSEYRNLLTKAENSEEATRQYIAMATLDFQRSQLPIYESYVGIGNLLMAKHALNPFSKMSYFRKGKKFLEAAIVKSPENLEIRFLRYTSQIEMPAILGYKDDIEEDRKFIVGNYKDSKDIVLVTQIKNILKN